MADRGCRTCAAELQHTFVDFGMSRFYKSYLTAYDAAEKFYPSRSRARSGAGLSTDRAAWVPLPGAAAVKTSTGHRRLSHDRHI